LIGDYLPGHTSERIITNYGSLYINNTEVMMSAYRGDNYGELMSFLLHSRERFESEEQFKEYALAEVRKFINDLRSIGIELTLRPNYGGQPISQYSVTQKLAK